MRSADRRAASRRLPPALLAAGLALALAGCGGMADDLFPSGKDLSGGAAGTTGPAVGQTAPDFTLAAAAGGEVTLSGALAGRRGAILYFTMWCDICDRHMSDMERELFAAFPDVRFLALDYVSGSAPDAAMAELNAGWADRGFTTLVDVGAVQARYFKTYMAVVVLDRDRVVRYRGEYLPADVRAALEAMPPVAP